MESKATESNQEGEENFGFQSEANDPQTWPTFKEKLDHFKSFFPPNGTDVSSEHDEGKDDHELEEFKNGDANDEIQISSSPKLSIPSRPSTSASPNFPESSKTIDVAVYADFASEPTTEDGHETHAKHHDHLQCYKCLLATALQGMIDHECGHSGLILEISESDDHHKENIKLVVSPKHFDDRVVFENESGKRLDSHMTELEGLEHKASSELNHHGVDHSLQEVACQGKENEGYTENEFSCNESESTETELKHRAEAIKVACGKVSPYSSSSSSGSIPNSVRSASGEKEELEDDVISHHKEQWSSPIEFLLSCIAMSVGLGNVWRFPFTAYENGGGAFLIPYLIVLFFIGRPLYFLELSLGQFSSKSSVRVWDIVPGFRGVGYGQVIATCSVVSYYTSLIALAIYYLCASFAGTLPWTVCDPSIDIKDVVCVKMGVNASEVVANLSLPENTTVMSSAEQYFLHSVLHHKENIMDGIGWPVLSLTGCLGLCYILLFLTLWKGVASSGKVAYFTAIFPYVVLITLLVRGVTLPGSMEGIMFYITPKWEQLLNINVWYQAVTQSFFSLSVGFGALINYSSHNDFRHNVYRDALIISLTDTFTSLLAGFTIFAILGNLAEELGVPIEHVVTSGTGLAFISYPSAIAKFDYAPQVFSVLFFLMLITLGLGSATGLISSAIGIVCDEKRHWNKTVVTFVVCLVGFVIGLVYITPGGQHILALVDFFGGGFIIFALATLEVFGFCWIYGLPTVLHDLKFMLGRQLGIYYKFCWGIFIPFALLFFFGYYLIFAFPELGYAGVPFPKAALYSGWCLTGFACIQVPYWLFHSMYFTSGRTVFKKFVNSLKPSSDWGPKNRAIRQDWLEQSSDRKAERKQKKDLKKQRKKSKVKN